MKVLLSLVCGDMAVWIFMMIGRWSDPRLVLTSQDVKGSRLRLASEMSGEVGCVLVASLVGLSSFITPKSAFPILSAMSLPL